MGSERSCNYAIPVPHRLLSFILTLDICLFARDDMHLWLAPFTSGGKHTITVTFVDSIRIAMIRIWVGKTLLKLWQSIFRAKLCFKKSLLSTFTDTQNGPVKLRGRYQMNFRTESKPYFFRWGGGYFKTVSELEKMAHFFMFPPLVYLQQQTTENAFSTVTWTLTTKLEHYFCDFIGMEINLSF